MQASYTAEAIWVRFPDPTTRKIGIELTLQSFGDAARLARRHFILLVDISSSMERALNVILPSKKKTETDDYTAWTDGAVVLTDSMYEASRRPPTKPAAALPAMKAALLRLVGTLRPGDILSMVTFNEQAECIAKRRTVGAQDGIEGDILNLKAGGRTDSGAAFALLDESFFKGGEQTTIFFLTDGQDNGFSLRNSAYPESEIEPGSKFASRKANTIKKRLREISGGTTPQLVPVGFTTKVDAKYLAELGDAVYLKELTDSPEMAAKFSIAIVRGSLRTEPINVDVTVDGKSPRRHPYSQGLFVSLGSSNSAPRTFLPPLEGETVNEITLHLKTGAVIVCDLKPGDVSSIIRWYHRLLTKLWQLKVRDPGKEISKSELKELEKCEEEITRLGVPRKEAEFFWQLHSAAGRLRSSTTSTRAQVVEDGSWLSNMETLSPVVNPPDHKHDEPALRRQDLLPPGGHYVPFPAAKVSPEFKYGAPLPESQSGTPELSAEEATLASSSTTATFSSSSSERVGEPVADDGVTQGSIPLHINRATTQALVEYADCHQVERPLWHQIENVRNALSSTCLLGEEASYQINEHGTDGYDLNLTPRDREKLQTLMEESRFWSIETRKLADLKALRLTAVPVLPHSATATQPVVFEEKTAPAGGTFGSSLGLGTTLAATRGQTGGSVALYIDRAATRALVELAGFHEVARSLWHQCTNVSNALSSLLEVGEGASHQINEHGTDGYDLALTPRDWEILQDIMASERFQGILKGVIQALGAPSRGATSNKVLYFLQRSKISSRKWHDDTAHSGSYLSPSLPTKAVGDRHCETLKAYISSDKVYLRLREGRDGRYYRVVVDRQAAEAAEAAERRRRGHGSFFNSSQLLQQQEPCSSFSRRL